MAAKYDFLSIPNPKDGGKTRILYPKLVTNGTVSWEQLVHEIASESSFEPGTVVGVMTEIERRVLHHLSYGYRVQVGGMCYAEASLQADREIKAENEIHAQSIHFGKINLQPAKNFRCDGGLERADRFRKFRESSSRFTEDERFARLQTYLQKHGAITRTQYSELTGLLRSNAQRELNKWIKAGKLTFEGRAPHRVYKLKETGEGNNILP